MPATAGAIAGAKLVGGSLVIPALTAGAVATDVALGATAYGAYSTYQQGQYQEDLYKDQAAQSIREGEQITEASRFEERESRIEGRELRARQYLQFAKGGVVPGTGTPLLVGEETAVDIERDIQRGKYGFGLESQRRYFEAGIQRKKGKAASRAGIWRAGSSLLTGAYRVASIYS
ncbi:hypothetical protein LCGC14_1128790 [marine sediment metagenome]|uniref:Uncharacterized protein n=1 Tax=marine sediment metagenome TaxID=412755 RepID=A0A0F9Q7K4_9ZZZZ